MALPGHRPSNTTGMKGASDSPRRCASEPAERGWRSFANSGWLSQLVRDRVNTMRAATSRLAALPQVARLARPAGWPAGACHPPGLSGCQCRVSWEADAMRRWPLRPRRRPCGFSRHRPRWFSFVHVVVQESAAATQLHQMMASAGISCSHPAAPIAGHSRLLCSQHAGCPHAGKARRRSMGGHGRCVSASAAMQLREMPLRRQP